MVCGGGAILHPYSWIYEQYKVRRAPRSMLSCTFHQNSDHLSGIEIRILAFYQGYVW